MKYGALALILIGCGNRVVYDCSEVDPTLRVQFYAACRSDMSLCTTYFERAVCKPIVEAALP